VVKESEETVYQENEQNTEETVVQNQTEPEAVSAETETTDTAAGDTEASGVVENQADETPEAEGEPAEAPIVEESVAEATESDEVAHLATQLGAKEREANEHYEARLRLQAEFDNFKKRKEKESLDFKKYAQENFVRDILPIVDDFERAIAAAEKTHKLEDFLQGVELIFDKFLDVLRKKGVKEIEARPGQPFNPEIHEAMTQIPTDEVEDGTIAQVLQKGYYLHDRVILAAKVAVAKKPNG
jgi:molecular chaperone GrpE